MINALILRNPTTITLTRHTKSDSFGTDVWTEEALNPITVSLYNITTHNQREYSIVEGQLKIATKGILATSDADIVVGHNSYDTFVENGRTYRIVGVRSYNVPSEHIQADCVAI